MATYTVTRHITYAETYVVRDVDTLEDADAVIDSGDVDPESVIALAEQPFAWEREDECDECGATTPELHASHCSAFGIPDDSRPGLTCRHCGQTITRDQDNDWVHAEDEVVGCGAPFGEQDPRTAEPTPEQTR